jgi:hypothetical protein
MTKPGAAMKYSKEFLDFFEENNPNFRSNFLVNKGVNYRSQAALEKLLSEFYKNQQTIKESEERARAGGYFFPDKDHAMTYGMQNFNFGAGESQEFSELFMNYSKGLNMNEVFKIDEYDQQKYIASYNYAKEKFGTTGSGKAGDFKKALKSMKDGITTEGFKKLINSYMMEVGGGENGLEALAQLLPNLPSAFGDEKKMKASALKMLQDSNERSSIKADQELQESPITSVLKEIRDIMLGKSSEIEMKASKWVPSPNAEPVSQVDIPRGRIF